MQNIRFKFCLPVTLLVLAACGDSGSGSDSESGDIVNKGGVKEGIAETVDDLANCSAKLEGNLVYISSEKAGYICDGETWKLDKAPLDDGDGGKDIDAGKIVNPDDDDNGSPSKRRSSSSTRKSSSSKVDVDEESSSSVQGGERSSSDDKEGSSDSGETQSSDGEAGLSSDSSETGSSGSEVASSSSSPVDEVAETLEKAAECTEARVGYRVYIQDEGVWYACTETGYVEEEGHSSSSESVAGESSDSAEVLESSNSESSSSRAFIVLSSSSIDLYDDNVEGLKHVIDTRDNHGYDLVTIGQQVWMTTNLNYMTTGGNADNKSGSWCYDNLSANCDSLGRLYTWAAAMDVGDAYNMASLSREDPVRGICPEGLRLPTSADWQELYDFAKSKTNLLRYGFVLPSSGGYAQVNLYSLLGFHKDGFYCWTSTEIADASAEIWSVDDVFWSHADQYKLNGFAVRCMESLPTLVTRALGECGDNERLGTFGRYDTVLYYCDKAYVTESGTVSLRYGWREATIVERDTYRGEGTEGIVVKGLETGTYYIYREGEWRKATLEESQTSVMGVCGTSSNLDGYGWYEGELYRCALDEGTQLFAWRKATMVEQDTYLDECTEGKVVIGVKYGIYYTCRSGEWDNATDMERETYGWTAAAENTIRVGRITGDTYAYFGGEWKNIEEWSWDVPKELRFNPNVIYGTMTDARDNQTYRTTKICNEDSSRCETWMAENLNYADSVKTPSLKGKSKCYGGVAKYCDVVGRFYTWAAAIDSVALANDPENPQICGYDEPPCHFPSNYQGICPDGWHLASYYSFTGTTLKTLSGWGGSHGYDNSTDDYGLSVLPAGNGSSGAGSYAYFWSLEEDASIYYRSLEWGDTIYVREAGITYLSYGWDVAHRTKDNKSSTHSVRCVKND